jgi:predicted GNAT family acetyltransferase
MTADGVAEHGLVTLGLYDDNAAARRVYQRLGFAVAHEVETWRPS